MNPIIYNPFIKIAGQKALGYGFLIILLTSLLCYFSGTRLDGAIDVHFGETTSAAIFFTDSLIAWLSTVIIFYPMAVILTRNQVRFIDIAGTFAFARFPMLLAPFLGFIMNTNKFHEYLNWKLLNNGSEVAFQPFDFLVFVASVLITLLFVVWLIALLYNAYKVSTNLKAGTLTVSFIVGIILAEILSKMALYFSGGLLFTYNIN